MMEDLKNILESLLLVAEEPLSMERLKKVLAEAEAAEISQALTELKDDFDMRRSGFYLAQVAGGYQLRTRPDYTEYVRRLVEPKPVRLSKAAVETLAIIAYKQPVIRSDVEHIRGVDCGGVLRQLLERKLVRVLGRREIPGRPLIYATTKRFLEVFDLKDLKDLPTPKEIEEFGQEPLAERGHIMIEPDEEQPDAAAHPPEAEAASTIGQSPEASASPLEPPAPAGPEAQPSGDSSNVAPAAEKKLDFDAGSA